MKVLDIILQSLIFLGALTTGIILMVKQAKAGNCGECCRACSVADKINRLTRR